MEQLALENLQTLTPTTSDAPNPHLHLKTLTLARSLLTNPNSSPSALLSAFQTLTLDLHRRDLSFARHVIKLIGDAAAVHRSLLPSAIRAVEPFLNGGDRTAADALAVLDSLGEYGALSEDVVVSLASSSIVSVRLRIARVLASRVDLVRPELMVRVFLGISMDLYPLVRKVAVDGVVGLLKKDGDLVDGSLVKCCYDRAVELLGDEDEIVRSVAIRLVSECGRLLAMTEAGKTSCGVMDVIFIKLCWMARDMSLKVRNEAFTALGNVRLVSEVVLIQSLSKKILKGKNGVGSLPEYVIKECKCPLASAAGAFVHGMEDEFHEVRTAACKSLGMLSILSIQFSDDALNLLMDMLNDDITAVRLQTLRTLFHMAANDHLTVQDKHMHMFLGSLADICAEIRYAAREVLRLMKLPKFQMFISSIDALIANLVTHPEEEQDIFLVLFTIGKKHGKFAAKRVKEFEQEIKPSCEGKLNLDSPQAAALLILAISLSSSDERFLCDVPATLFFYSVLLFGRISHSLRDFVHNNLLLVCLIHHSKMQYPARILKPEESQLLPCVGDSICNTLKHFGQASGSLLPIHCETSEISFKEKMFDSIKSTSLEQSREKQSYLDQEITQSIHLIFKRATETWLLIKSQCTHKARRILRGCKEELEMIAWNADDSTAALLAFGLYYVQIIQLFAEIWEQLQPKLLVGITALDLLLGELDIYLKRMRYNFSGLRHEDECHILELTLLYYVFRMCTVGICSSLILNKLQAVFSRLEHLSEEGSLKLSDFYKELKKAYIEQVTGEVTQPFLVHKLIKLFGVECIPSSRGLRHIKAELSTTGYDSEKPLPFVSGLPVGIPFQITLYNISNKDLLWVRMAVHNSVQYAFLDICQFEGSDEVSKCMITLPFYATPKAASFSLRACVCMECPLNGVVHCRKEQGGPRNDVILLNEESDIYFLHIGNR